MKSFHKSTKFPIKKGKRLPKFIIYSLIHKAINSRVKYKNQSSKINILFQCNRCKKSFKSFPHLKRHYIEVEYGIKMKCKYCGIKIKKIKEHEKICKKAKDIGRINFVKSNSINLIQKKKQIY